jgi:hypothetical protein
MNRSADDHQFTRNELKELLESITKPPIDPTANVLSLVGAAMQRQDDLRAAEQRRLDDLARVQEHCDRESDDLREKLRRAESARIDAVNLAESRRVDSRLDQQQQSVAIASKEAAATAEALRSTVASTAEALRAQGAATTLGINAAIKVLEEKQYQAGGRDLQRVEGRQSSQYLIAFLVSLPAMILAVVLAIKMFAH